MKKLFQGIVIIVILMMAVVSYAQEWNKDQQEVWKVVENTWKSWSENNVDGVAANMHEKYQGWSDDSPLPMGKQSLVAWFSGMKDLYTMNFYNVEPARITVLKNAAVVDYYYYYSITMKGEDTKTKEENGKAVEFYVKEGSSWLLLGDMMTHEDEDED